MVFYVIRMILGQLRTIAFNIIELIKPQDVVVDSDMLKSLGTVTLDCIYKSTAHEIIL